LCGSEREGFWLGLWGFGELVDDGLGRCDFDGGCRCGLLGQGFGVLEVGLVLDVSVEVGGIEVDVGLRCVEGEPPDDDGEQGDDGEGGQVSVGISRFFLGVFTFSHP